nr:phosphatidate cytidylyltransferase [Bacillota bacterium]
MLAGLPPAAPGPGHRGLPAPGTPLRRPVPRGAGIVLRRRVLTAAAGIPLVAAAWLLAPWGLTALAAVIGAVGALELGPLLARAGLADVRFTAAAMVFLAQAVGAAAEPQAAAAASAVALAGAWLAVTAVLMLGSRAGGEGAPARLLAQAGGTLLAAFWLAWPLSLWPVLYRLGAAQGRAVGLALSALPVVVTWLCDTAAYFAGLRWGRHRLAPALSPAKSVEGALAGLAAGAAGGAVVALWLPWSPAGGAAAGLLIAAAAQAGDLLESAVKRTAGVKDSGRLLPGHGGVLDRFDALLAAVPAAYLAAAVWLAR